MQDQPDKSVLLALETVHSYAARVGILVPEPEQVETYLDQHGSFKFKLVKGLRKAKGLLGKKVQLSLEMFYEPDSDDCFLTLQVRRKSYPRSWWRSLRQKTCEVVELVDPAGDAYCHITSDFALPKRVKSKVYAA